MHAVRDIPARLTPRRQDRFGRGSARRRFFTTQRMAWAQVSSVSARITTRPPSDELAGAGLRDGDGEVEDLVGALLDESRSPPTQPRESWRWRPCSRRTCRAAPAWRSRRPGGPHPTASTAWRLSALRNSSVTRPRRSDLVRPGLAPADHAGVEEFDAEDRGLLRSGLEPARRGRSRRARRRRRTRDGSGPETGPWRRDHARRPETQEA